MSGGPPPANSGGTRLRRAHTLTVSFDNEHMVLRNALLQRAVTCNSWTLAALSQVDDWQTIDDIVKLMERSWVFDARTKVDQLIELGALVVEGSAEARRDQDFQQQWEWKPFSGPYHLGVRNPEYIADEDQIADDRARYWAEKPPPVRYSVNDPAAPVLALPEPDGDDMLLAVMAARRSRRTFAPDAVPLEHLSQCLHSALKIERIVQNDVLGEVAITMTPSGGAQNPFEAFVYARSVSATKPGIYHYGGLDHTLGWIADPPVAASTDWLGGQVWTERGGAIIFLAAYLERTMSRYRHEEAYRSVMIEAGHIAQNILLTAEHLGLSACVTTSVADDAVEAMLGISAVTQCVPYVIVMGTRDPDGWTALSAPRPDPSSPASGPQAPPQWWDL